MLQLLSHIPGQDRWHNYYSGCDTHCIYPLHLKHSDSHLFFSNPGLFNNTTWNRSQAFLIALPVPPAAPLKENKVGLESRAQPGCTPHCATIDIFYKVKPGTGANRRNHMPCIPGKTLRILQVYASPLNSELKLQGESLWICFLSSNVGYYLRLTCQFCFIF